MTEPSSAGNPGGPGNSAEDPLGPSYPPKPAPGEPGHKENPRTRPAMDTASENTDVAGLHPDRREAVLEKESGKGGPRHSGSIASQQGVHPGGTVPASFTGAGTSESEAASDSRTWRPEDALEQPEAWDERG